MVFVLEDDDFDKFAKRFRLPVTEGVVTGNWHFNSSWINESKTKYISTHDLLIKLLKENNRLKERINLIEELMENGIVLENEDKAFVLIKYKKNE